MTGVGYMNFQANLSNFYDFTSPWSDGLDPSQLQIQQYAYFSLNSVCKNIITEFSVLII